MNEFIESQINYESILRTNMNLFKKIYHKVNKLLSYKRPVMYSDIINLIIREELKGENYNQLILLCNHKIRKGNYLVNIDDSNF